MHLLHPTAEAHASTHAVLGCQHPSRAGILSVPAKEAPCTTFTSAAPVLRVSRLCLGTDEFPGHTSESDSFQIMDRALDPGINFFDSANVYGWKGRRRRDGTDCRAGWPRAADGVRRWCWPPSNGRMGDWPNQS